MALHRARIFWYFLGPKKVSGNFETERVECGDFSGDEDIDGQLEFRSTMYNLIQIVINRLLWHEIEGG